MSISSFVISLKNQTERRKHIQKIFGDMNLHFDFFDAINKNNIDQVLNKHSIKLTASHLSKGEVACYLSHFCLWKLLIDNNLEYIAIFEDDIYLANDTYTLFNDLHWLPSNFDVIKLETMHEKIFIKKGIKISEKRRLAKINSMHMGTAGYIVSYQGACNLIKGTIENGINIPVDHFIFGWLRIQNDGIYQINPSICIQDKVLHENNPVFDSCLEDTRSDKPKKAKVKGFKKVIRELNRLKIQLTSNDYVISLIKSIKGYRKEVIEYEP